MAEDKRKKRSNGEGSITLRKDGRYELKVMIGTKEDGKPKFKSFYGKSEREVKKKHKEYIAEMARNPVETVKQTVGDYIYHWLVIFKKKSIKPQSYDRLYNIYQYHIKDTIGYIQMCNITSKDIQQLINDKSETMSYSSVKKIYELLNSCFKHAVNSEDLRKNPMNTVTMPKQSNMNVKTKEIQIYTQEEIDKLTHAIYETTFNNKRQLYRYSPIFILILNTGLRVGEVCALTWDNVDLENKTLHVNGSLSFSKTYTEDENSPKRKVEFTDPKSKSSNRIIPLNQKAINALDELKRRNTIQGIKSKYVCCDLKGGFLTQRNISRTLQNLCTREGVEYKGIHSLRHNFATALISKGVDVRTVSDLLGHSNIQTTLSIYAHSLKENRVKAITSLDLI